MIRLTIDRVGIVIFCPLFAILLVPIGVFFGVLSAARLAEKVYGEFVPQAWRSTRRVR